jgi:hypothetical protein
MFSAAFEWRRPLPLDARCKRVPLSIGQRSRGRHDDGRDLSDEAPEVGRVDPEDGMTVFEGVGDEVERLPVLSYRRGT